MDTDDLADRGRRAMLEESADRRAARLTAWRLNKSDLEAAFLAALKKYELNDAAAFGALRAQMEYSALAAKSAVRSHGIMLWFPFLPKEVTATLTALVSFYHGEAKQMVDLYRKEGQSGTWSEEEDLDEEIIHAASMTKIRSAGKSIAVENFDAFGLSKDEPTPLKCPGMWIEHFVVGSRVMEDTARVLAVCKVARVYLDSSLALRDVKDGRWEEARKALIELCDVSANVTLKLPATIAAVNEYARDQASMTFFCNTMQEIKGIGEEAASGDRLCKIAKGRLLAVEHEARHVLLAVAIEDETDDVGDLSDQCDEMAAELLELEDGEGGVGRLFGAWRLLQIG